MSVRAFANAQANHQHEQEKLGEMLGITFQQVQKYEKGSNRISASRLYYARRFGVPLQAFFEDLPGVKANRA
jgi:transcriptional regulator with XRE-family HTH domain